MREGIIVGGGRALTPVLPFGEAEKKYREMRLGPAPKGVTEIQLWAPHLTLSKRHKFKPVETPGKGK